MRAAFWLMYGLLVGAGIVWASSAVAVPGMKRDLLTFSYSNGTFNTLAPNCASVVRGLVNDLNARARLVQWAAAPGGCNAGFSKVGEVQPVVIRSYLLLDGTSNKEHSINVTLTAWVKAGRAS